MPRPTLTLALALATLSLVAMRADADVIGPAPTCAPWETVERSHGSSRCVARRCQRDGECPSARCQTRRVCVVTEEVWVSRPGPCRDLDGDGQCDRTRTTRDREAGACPASGPCAEGRCQTLGECRPR